MAISGMLDTLTLAVLVGAGGIILLLAVAGLIESVLGVVLYMRFGSLLRLMLNVIRKGGKMALHWRGINIDPVYIEPVTTKFDLTDNDGRKRSFNIPSKGATGLFFGIPTTLAIDDLPNTFAAPNIIDMAEQMTNSHIQNIKKFGAPLRDDAGNILAQRVPVLDNEGKHAVNEKGELLFKEIPIITYPIDEKAPGYKVPEFLSAQNLAEQIEMDKLITDRAAQNKGDKTLMYIGIAAGAVLVGVAVLALILMYAKAPDCNVAAGGVVTTVTTTLSPYVVWPTTTPSTTLFINPPPIV